MALKLCSGVNLRSKDGEKKKIETVTGLGDVEIRNNVYIKRFK